MRARGWVIFFVASFAAIGLVGHYIATHPDKFPSPDTKATTVKPANPIVTALDSLEIKTFSITKSGLGGTVAIGTFTLENKGALDVKDVQIHCDYKGESGTVIDTSSPVIYEIFKAHSTRTVRQLNMGFVHPQATQTGCRIVNLSLAIR